MAARLKERFEKEIRPALMKELGQGNPMQVPRLEKIVVNMGLGEAINNGKIIDASVAQLSAISGQKPVVTKARKSIANFKLREGQSIGAMVTLRGDRMYEFFDRLVSVALPRVRDFKGVSPKAFDGKGNYTLGIREQIIFPEINYDQVEKIKGLNITVVTTALTTRGGAFCSASSACPSAPKPQAIRRYHGQAFQDGAGQAQAEVQGAAVQPLPALRAAARLPPQVPDVPALLPQACAAGRDHRRHQVELVRETVDELYRSHWRHADAYPQRVVGTS